MKELKTVLITALALFLVTNAVSAGETVEIGYGWFGKSGMMPNSVVCLPGR